MMKEQINSSIVLRKRHVIVCEGVNGTSAYFVNYID